MSATRTVDIPSTRQMSRGLNVAHWALQIAGAVMIGMAGYMKLVGVPDMVGLFDAIGIGQWFRYVTGGLEFGGAVLLLVPPLAGLAAIVLALVMVGAILTHWFIVGGSALMPFMLLTALLTVAYGRRDRTLRILGR